MNICISENKELGQRIEQMTNDFMLVAYIVRGDKILEIQTWFETIKYCNKLQCE